MARVSKYIPTETAFYLPEGARRTTLTVDPHGVASFEFLMLGGEPEACRFPCPCGCGDEVFLYLTNSRRERGEYKKLGGHVWDSRTAGHLIHPSVNHTDGCRSHYFIKEDGTVSWC